MTNQTNTSETSKKLFGGKRASAYEARVRQVVPGYDALHDLSYLLLNRAVGDGGHVLIAGCGSGNDLLSLARECPNRTFTAFDPSPDMMDLATETVNTAKLTNRCQLLTGTIDNIREDAQFDAATLMLVMHFVPDIDGPTGKRHLLKSISSRLKPGAPFVFAEALADRASVSFAADLDLWRQSMRLAGMDPDEEAKGFKKIVSQMPLIGEPRLRELLNAAEFGEPELFYREHLIHGWLVRKR